MVVGEGQGELKVQSLKLKRADETVPAQTIVPRAAWVGARARLSSLVASHGALCNFKLSTVLPPLELQSYGCKIIACSHDLTERVVCDVQALKFMEAELRQ